MTTKLERPLRREIVIDGEPWVITITPTALKLTPKGRRKGVELEWKALINGDAALAAALNASVREPRRQRADQEDSRPESAARRPKAARRRDGPSDGGKRRRVARRDSPTRSRGSRA